MAAALQNDTLLDLSEPRVIKMYDRGRSFSVTCRRVTQGDWFAFYAQASVTEQQLGKERLVVNDFDSARIHLAEHVAVEASGYGVLGGGTIMDLPGWQTRLPLAHRRQIGATLGAVQVSEDGGDLTILPEGEEVYLDATWSAFGNGMQRFTGLRHTLKTPSAAQHKRFNEASSRSIVVGGSRAGKTVYPGSQRLLAELYDELILEVGGYVADVLLNTRDTIVQHMDTHHKVVAAQELFNPRSTVSTEAIDDEIDAMGAGQ